MEHKILVACIGNVFLGDDGFGVEVARRLAQRQLPSGVRVIDYGIRSFDLAYALVEEWELVILVDAAARGGRPGTTYLIEPDLTLLDDQPHSLDAHTMDPVAVLQLTATLSPEKKVAAHRLLVVGCEPSPIDPEQIDMKLSPPVEAAVEEACNLLQELVADFPASLEAGAVRK